MPGEYLKRRGRPVYPLNQHIKEKIRQKLQILRAHGYLEFLGRGIYRLATLGGTLAWRQVRSQMTWFVNTY
jgi:hypothetical protein